MDEYVFGANILENLTTGMYQDSKVIFREYIQNACDQIDKACMPEYGLFQSKAEGRIKIWIDPESRSISIEDNATGIPADKFRQTLANVADSDKKIGEDKGFRGIGRLCGLAYCKALVFRSKAPGESVISVMRCDALKMRDLIAQSQEGKKLTASYILHEIYSFSTEDTALTDEHWFKVELIDISAENHDLLDENAILEYLSFVAPVPYQNKFIFRKKVYDHALEIGFPIDEYHISINGEQVYKHYGTRFKTSKGDDEIFDVAFHDFIGPDGKIIAWAWFGLSRFKAVISKECKMRGLRLRKENIQIGNDDALQGLFREDRGHHYFVGEVFAVAKDLLPNSQRDYFNENACRVAFERLLRDFFEDELRKIYYDGSSINSAYAKIEAYEQKDREHQQRTQRGDYVDETHRMQAAQEVEAAREKAEAARKTLERLKKNQTTDSVASMIISRIETHQNEGDSASATETPIVDPSPVAATSAPRATKLSKYSKKEQKLISRIYSVIVASTDAGTAERIISKIEEELK